MRRTALVALAALALVAMTAADFADAKRLGGGRSLGTQRQSVAPTAPTAPTAPSGAASNPVMPAQPGAAAAKPAVPAAAPAPSGASRWLGPLAGLAAGIGLAALLSHFGLSESFASLLLVGLLVVAGIVVVRMLMARRTAASAPMRYAPAGGMPPAAAPEPATWGGSTRVEPVLAPATGAKSLPPGFDAAAFVTQAKLQFRRLQAAYDSGDHTALADVMTPGLYTEIAREIAERGTHRPTEVVALDARVLEVTTENGNHWASVQFTGSLREDGELLEKALDEVWNLTKPVTGNTGWLLAGIQQMA